MAVILDVEKAAFSYQSNHSVFHDISFTLKQGEIFSLIGPNGTGKSTLIKCLIDILRIESGSIRFFDHDITTMKRSDIAKIAGYVPQTHQVVFPFSVLEFVLMGRAPYVPPFSSPGRRDKDIARSSMEHVGISHLEKRTISEISGGEYQLAMLARSITQKPDVLILDEPTSHLDIGNQVRILSIIEKLAKSGISIIQSTHFPDQAFFTGGSSSAILQGGTLIAQGSTSQVITRENLKKAYGIDVLVHYNEEAGKTVCIPITDRNKKIIEI